MLTDDQKAVIRCELNGLTRNAGVEFFLKHGIELFFEDVEALLCEHKAHWQYFDELRRDKGHERGVGKFKVLLRARLAYRIALFWGLYCLPKPRQSDDTPFNKVMGILFTAADCPVNGKQRRDTLRRALQGFPKHSIPPPYPAPDVRQTKPTDN